jgi:hypothetical protein
VDPANRNTVCVTSHGHRLNICRATPASPAQPCELSYSIYLSRAPASCHWPPVVLETCHIWRVEFRGTRCPYHVWAWEGWPSRCLLTQSWPHLEANTSSYHGLQLDELIASSALNGLVVRSGYMHPNGRRSFTPLCSSIRMTSTFQSGEPQISSKLSGSRGFSPRWRP